MSDVRDWPALVLTAGLATRLRPLSALRAKAALPVAGRPLIGRIFEWLRGAGIRRVVVNLHHRPETIAALVGDGSEWGLEVRYSWERRILGSAGGPRHALPLLDAERFLIINGDTLTNCDLRGVVKRHVDSRARVTMAVVPGDVTRYGGVLVDDESLVGGFSRARDQGNIAAGLKPLHFIGVQAVERDVFRDVSDDQPSETVRTLYPSLIAADHRSIAAFVSDAEFLDIGTPADYWQTVAKVAAREQRSSLDRGSDCHVADDARLVDTILWDRVTVDSRAHLFRCVVADDVRVPEGAVHENAVLTAGSNGLSVTPF